MIKLTALNPRFVGAAGEGVYNADGSPAVRREGVGLGFDCPCPKCSALRTGNDDDDFHLRHFIPFTNPLDGGSQYDIRQGWTRTGDTFETIILMPSILSDATKGGCGWHGYVGQDDEGKPVPGMVRTI
jgi:hypothetical protein